MRRRRRGHSDGLRLIRWCLGLLLALSLLAIPSPSRTTRRAPAALDRAGYELAPDLTRIWVTVAHGSWPSVPRPTLQDGAIVVVFPGLIVDPQLQDLQVEGDNVVRAVRFANVSGGAMMRVIGRDGLSLTVHYSSENEAYFLEIERPAALRPSPQISAAELARLKESGVKIVILDPGHGGRDPGTHGHGLVEKDEVLTLSREIQKKIEAVGGGRVRVFLTRTGDYNLGSLQDDRLLLRLKEAARLQGDLFLSIHLNQFYKSSVSGWEIHVPETYTDSRLADMVGHDPSAINDLVVKGETHGDDPDLDKLLLKQIQAHMEDYDPSRLWAGVLARELAGVREIRGRGIKTTNKFVTGNLAMPSILLEVGYLSSGNDARWVRNPRFRERLGTAIGNAVVQYLFSPETQLTAAPPTGAAASSRPSQGSRPSALAAPAAAGRPSPAAPAKPAVHKLKKHETLSEIARKYGVSVTALLRANGLTARGARHLQEGRTIKIP